MAVASIQTLLPLETWAKILGLNPYWFNQISEDLPDSVISAAQCDHVLFQHFWQKDYIAREQIAEAIHSAEEMLAEVMGYWPAPKYFIDEDVDYPRPWRRHIRSNAITLRGDWKPVQLRWGRFQGGGLLNRTILTASPGSLVFSDPDGDGLNDAVTITLSAAFSGGNVSDAKEIGVYYTSADRNGEPISETWRIRPLRVSISGTTVTIVGKRYQFVKPDLMQVYSPKKLDANLATNFVTEVEVYRTFTDNTATDDFPFQGVAVWQNNPGCTGVDCTESVAPVCAGRWDNKIGMPYYGIPSPWPHNHEPDHLVVNYRAGFPLDQNGNMDAFHAKLVTYLSVALLDNAKCGCAGVDRILSYWRQRPNESSASDRRGFTTAEIETNPFVERNGALWAWKRVRNKAMIGGVGV